MRGEGSFSSVTPGSVPLVEWEGGRGLPERELGALTAVPGSGSHHQVRAAGAVQMHKLTLKAKRSANAKLPVSGARYKGNSYATVGTFCFSMSLLKGRNN